MKRFLIPIIAALLIAGGLLSYFFIFNSPERKLSRRLNEAQTFVSAGNFDSAIAAYNEIISMDATNVDAYMQLASIYVDKEEYYLARTALDEGYLITKDATILLRLQEVNEAITKIEEYEAALEAARLAEAARQAEFLLTEDKKTVYFGRYEQDGDELNGKDPIEWIVLDTVDDKMLVVSKNILDCVAFNNEYADIDWANSTIRAWLNETFINNAFTTDEQERILQSEVINMDPNAPVDASNGGNTLDKIFLLSEDEVLKYWPEDTDENRRAASSKVAIDNGVWTLTEDRYEVLKNSGEDLSEQALGAGWWWLRNSGGKATFAMDVSADGKIREYGHEAFKKDDGIRPAMWIVVEE